MDYGANHPGRGRVALTRRTRAIGGRQPGQHSRHKLLRPVVCAHFVGAPAIIGEDLRSPSLLFRRIPLRRENLAVVLELVGVKTAERLGVSKDELQK